VRGKQLQLVSQRVLGGIRRITCRRGELLLAVAHYTEVTGVSEDYIRIHAVLGGKNPHLQTYLGAGWRRRWIRMSRARTHQSGSGINILDRLASKAQGIRLIRQSVHARMLAAVSSF